MDVFLTHLALLIPAFSLLYAPPLLTQRLLSEKNAPLPSSRQIGKSHSFGDRLEPRWIIGAAPLNQ